MRRLRCDRPAARRSVDKSRRRRVLTTVGRREGRSLQERVEAAVDEMLKKGVPAWKAHKRRGAIADALSRCDKQGWR